MYICINVIFFVVKLDHTVRLHDVYIVIILVAT